MATSQNKKLMHKLLIKRYIEVDKKIAELEDRKKKMLRGIVTTCSDLPIEHFFWILIKLKAMGTAIRWYRRSIGPEDLNYVWARKEVIRMATAFSKSKGEKE